MTSIVATRSASGDASTGSRTRASAPSVQVPSTPEYDQPGPPYRSTVAAEQRVTPRLVDQPRCDRVGTHGAGDRGNVRGAREPVAFRLPGSLFARVQDQIGGVRAACPAAVQLEVFGGCPDLVIGAGA